MGANELVVDSLKESTHRNANTATTPTTAIISTASDATTTTPSCTSTSTSTFTSNITTSTTTTAILQKHHLPRATPPQVIIIPASQASTVTNAAKKIRRAFSMPRNPFRFSRKYKTSMVSNCESDGDGGGGGGVGVSCVGGNRGRTGSIISLNSNGNVREETSETRTDTVGGVAAEHVKIDRKTGKQGVLRRSSFRKFLNRIAQHVSNSVNAGSTSEKVTFIDIVPFYTGCWRRKEANKHASSAHVHALSGADRVPPISGYQWPPDQTPGVMGLKNHGNTCFMNAVLQCLSHTDILAEYFVLDQYKADLKRRNKINSRKFGTKGELTEQLANVLKALWTCKNESDHSTSFKAVVDRYGSQFRSSTQHDAQEFLFWLLDKVHEDLNTATKRRYKNVKNNYGRPDEVIAAETLANHIRCNNSFVQAVFQAQFRSSLTCPRCKKQSNTFDPFHCISVQLPQLIQQTIFVTVVYLKQQPRQVKLGLTVPSGSPIVALREQLSADAGIAVDRMVLVEMNKEGFSRVFFDTQPVATLNGIDTIYCIEVPESEPQTAAGAAIVNSKSIPIAAKANEICAATPDPVKNTNNVTAADLLLLVVNVRQTKTESDDDSGGGDGDRSGSASANGTTLTRFGVPFSIKAARDCTYNELQKKLLCEMSPYLKPDVFTYTTPLTNMFQMRLQDPSADPDTYLEQVEHPLLTEMIDLALSVLSAEAGPPHIKLVLEWSEPEQHYADLSDTVVEDESVARLLENKSNDTASLTLEQCLEHYTKAETLSAEDAWRCPHCQQYLPVVKTLGLWSLPDILVVHFKRFRQHQEKGANAAKLTTMVTFPLNAFDMSPHLARGLGDECGNSLNPGNALEPLTSQFARPSPWKKTRTGDSRSSTLNSRDNRETCYDLYAVCYHQGDTLETGHYTAACKNPYDRQWYKFDDQRVSKVPSDCIQDEIINNEAYMLFYQRRTGDVIECSGSSSNSGDHWVSRIVPPAAQPTEKVNASNDKNTEEIPPIAVVVTTDTKAEKDQLNKSLEVPNINEIASDEVEEESPAIVVAKELLAQPVVNKQTEGNDAIAVDVIVIEPRKSIVNGEKENDELKSLPTDGNNSSAIIETEQQIFEMDEDCQLAEVAPIAKIENTASEHKEESTPKITTALVNSAPLPITLTAPRSPINGQMKEPSKTLPDARTPPDGRSQSTSNTSVSSSSVSSLSSCASPRSLAVSIHGASTLQTKFNGYGASHNHKESLLSSSLKSNSSSIIGNALAAHAHDHQLSRQQHHNWNGSRSSVSAVEHCSQSLAPHAMHGLNLRHSFSTSSNYKLRECSETLTSMLRNNASSCSKDTLIYIDQQNHHHHHHHNHHSLLEDEDDSYMGSRSLWISPVTPHKLITVSPKN